MEGLKVDGRMKVKTLKENFKKTFGYTLRVYNTQNHFVDEELLLADVRQDDSVKTGEFSIDPEWTIDEFEKNFKDAFAIKVHVATQDDSALAENNLKVVSGKSLKVEITLLTTNCCSLTCVKMPRLQKAVKPPSTRLGQLTSLKRILCQTTESKFRYTLPMIPNLQTTT